MQNSKSANSSRKWARIILIDFIIIAVIVCLFAVIRYTYHPDINIKGVYLKHPLDIPDINLIDQDGNTFTKEQLQGHWTLVFFGFTHCPMICPTTLDALNKMHTILQKELSPELLPQVVFITIDPERDTVARLKQYVNSYNLHFIGTRADRDRIKKLENQLSISVSNNKGNIAHTTDILLLNSKAQIQAYFLYPHYPVTMANDYKKIIGWIRR